MRELQRKMWQLEIKTQLLERRVKEVEARVEQIMAAKEKNSAGTRKPGEKRKMSGTEHTRGPGKTSSMSLLMLCLLNVVMVLLQSLPDPGEMTGRQVQDKQ
jgi:hypothetical protein